MNAGRGLKRLAIVFGVPWFLFWGFAAYVNLPLFLDPETDPHVAARATENVLMAFAAIVLLPVLVGLAYWVYRGFSPDK